MSRKLKLSIKLSEFYQAEWREHIALAEIVSTSMYPDFSRMLEIWLEAIQTGHKLLFFGNGGSASDAQHLAAELTVRYQQNRRALPAISLCSDISALTAAGNDFGFHTIFARQIEALGQPGDVAIGISTSGKSPNVVKGLVAAKALGLSTVAFSGGDGGDLVGLASPILLVPSDRTMRIQEMHITLGQMLCGALERELGLV